MTATPPLGLEHTFATALEGMYIPYEPPGFPNPQLVLLNEPLLEELGLDPDSVVGHGPGWFSGTALPTDARPLAQAYAGHQFGSFNPQLGDGRAVLLGEVVDTSGQRRDVQLKGSGPTPFSRGGDGKATLGPILREYLLGEAMFHLGVPTTRGLAVVTTGEAIVRDEPLPGAVLTRVASSHLRVGTLQFFAVRRDHQALRRLVDYALARHYPDRVDQGNPAVELLRAVAKAQGRLIARWMNVGFVHGVMNTDNTTLSGETIDYGPAAFMDTYGRQTVFSSIDHGARYAYGNQPGIGQWNLARLGEALRPLLAEDQDEMLAIVQDAMKLYATAYQDTLLAGVRAKVGLTAARDDDAELLGALLQWMEETGQDYTSTFRMLGDALLGQASLPADAAFQAWHGAWLTRLGDVDKGEVGRAMNAVNPIYIPRNHQVEAALDAAIAGDLGPYETLLDVLRSPFDVRPGLEAYAGPAPAGFGRYTTFCGT